MAGQNAIAPTAAQWGEHKARVRHGLLPSIVKTVFACRTT